MHILSGKHERESTQPFLTVIVLYVSSWTYTVNVLCYSLKACSKFVNNNEVTKLAKSSAKSPELLAKFCDTLLRKRYNSTIMYSYSIVFYIVFVVCS